jgi:NAD-dependent dihydropyrimidine dehydrogenase PreA subunit
VGLNGTFALTPGRYVVCIAPTEIHVFSKEIRMPAQVNQENCSGCGDCVTVCPVDGTVTLEDGKAVVKAEDCIECNACVDACSSDAMAMKE